MLKRILTSALVALSVAVIGVTFAARDGSGTYTLPAGNPVSTGTTISSTWANTTLTDIATALTNSIAKDGQTVASANLPMGGFKHTNVADATARNHYAAAGQVQDFSMQTLSSVSGTNTILGSLSPTITSYATGMLVSFVPANSNTGATTLAINGLSARSIVKRNGTALIAGDLVSGIPAVLVASSSQFILLNPLTDMTAAQVLAQLVTVDGSGSGLDADTLDGWNLASTATANTVAGRDSSGYLWAAYLNQSSANSENPTISQFMVTNGSDGFLRKASVASAASQLQGSISIATSQVTSGTFADARIAQSNVTQHMAAGYARNITGKAGTTKTLSTSDPSGGSDGDIWYKY